jgi:hypothetical protein
VNLGRPQTIIVIARHLADFYEFVKPRQEVRHHALTVLLDRREGERRRWSEATKSERRQSERRNGRVDAARAQLGVLGFSVLHRLGGLYSA